MIWIGLAVLAFVLYLAIGVIVFFRQDPELKFGLDREVFQKFKSKSDLQDLEEIVQKQPESVDDRATLIRAYHAFEFNLRQSGQVEAAEEVLPKLRENVLWFIKNRPDFPVRWTEWGMPFIFEDHEKLQKLWTEALKQRDKSYFLLSNASEFFVSSAIHPNEFALEIAERFPLDPQFFYRSGTFLERVDRRRLKYNERFLSIYWGTDDYRALELAKVRVGNLFYPTWWARILLRRRASNTFRPFASWYGYAIEDALNLGETESAKKFVPFLKARLGDEIFGNNTILIGAHTALARLAIHERDEAKLAEEIQTLMQIEKKPSDVGHWSLYGVKLLTELMTNGHQAQAKLLFINLKDAYPNGNFIPEMEAILNGEM